MRCCKTCRWFDRPPWYGSDDDEDALGFCEWPASNLPWSLRYGNRERMSVAPTEGTECPCHAYKPETPVVVSPCA